MWYLRRTKARMQQMQRWGLLALCMLFCFPFLTGASSNPKPNGGDAVVLTLVGSINPGTADYIRAGIQKAAASGAAMVVIKMDTPGGLLQATREIVKSILNAEIPVAVFVTPSGARAGSAGVFITMAGHVAAMSPGTNIGAAHPVVSGGKDPEKAAGKHMAAKILNDTVAFIKAIAKKRKRNVEWAKKAVVESDSITAGEALKMNVVDVLAHDVRDLLQKIDGKTVIVGQKKVVLKTKNMPLRDMDMTLKQKVVNFFANPQIAYFLMMFGMLGIMMEIYHPGAIFPGTLGAICLFLAFVSFQVIPINYGGLALILLGVLLLVAELLTPTFGLLFVGGMISLTFGSLFLIDSPDPNMRIGLSTVLPTVGVLSVVLGAVLFAVLKTYGKPVMSGEEGMVGEVGVVRTALSPRGTIRVRGEQWNAESVEGTLDVGENVRVVALDGLRLRVVSATNDNSSKAST
ncbi:MAG: nodulation protein NfeD [Deltaproteobacteria bacterium]|nr:MAG: nodulation protein NfeD [Deltaproteobacteria bacterium]